MSMAKELSELCAAIVNLWPLALIFCLFVCFFLFLFIVQMDNHSFFTTVQVNTKVSPLNCIFYKGNSEALKAFCHL